MSNESEVTLNLGTDDNSQFGEKLDELRTYAIAPLTPLLWGEPVLKSSEGVAPFT
jgi:hypothetical protein